jgi:hypothetical protein
VRLTLSKAGNPLYLNAVNDKGVLVCLIHRDVFINDKFYPRLLNGESVQVDVLESVPKRRKALDVMADMLAKE